METRANFVLIGAFTLAAVIGAFAFVMWIVGHGAAGSHRHYQVVFEGSVSGLSVGGNVLFNGLKVGEVTNLSFVKDNPGQVVADIDVTNETAPINASTKAQLETQGLVGTGVVALKGGEVKGAAELTGNPPIIESLPTATLADLQTKAGYVLDLANKILVDNAAGIHQTVDNMQEFSTALAHNANRLDEALASIADLGRTIEPLAKKAQALSDDADALIKGLDASKVNGIVANVQTFTQALAASSGDAEAILRDGADLIARLNESSGKLDSAIAAMDAIAKAVNPSRVADVVNSSADVADTLRQNRGNIDATLKNASEISAKLNDSADKLDGLMTSAQGFLGSPETKGALAQVGDAAASIKRLADNVDSHVKDIAAGLTRFSGSGLRQYESLAIQGQRVLDDIDRVVRSFERDPSQIIWGAKRSLPDYHGGQ